MSGKQAKGKAISKPPTIREQYPGITTELVLDCLDSNSRGDGVLYAMMHKGRIMRDMLSEETYTWAGHHWSLDVMGLDRDLVEDLALVYLETAREMRANQKQAATEGKTDVASYYENRARELRKRASRLRASAGVRGCLEFAFVQQGKISISARGDEFGTDPMHFGCANGVLELDTGELRDGDPRDLIVKASPVAMPPLDTPIPPIFKQYLWESLEDQHLIDFLQRYLGYCMTGLTTEEVFLVNGGAGRSGKTVLMETVMAVLGPYSGPIQAEMLLDQGRQKSSSGPTPDIMSLCGRRLAVASESDEARRFSPSRIKWFTGSDTLVGRNPHDRYERHFRPTHKLILLTNNEPYAPPDDFAFWSRLLKVDWPFSFVHSPNPSKDNEKLRDDHLKAKLMLELPGILAWMVRGALWWQREGLNPPPSVREAGEKYRREQDIIQDFIDERCITPDDSGTVKTTGNDLYSAFKDWFQEYHRSRVPSITWFGRRMSKKFTKRKDGVVYYEGVAVRETGSEKEPF